MFLNSLNYSDQTESKRGVDLGEWTMGKIKVTVEKTHQAVDVAECLMLSGGQCFPQAVLDLCSCAA